MRDQGDRLDVALCCDFRERQAYARFELAQALTSSRAHVRIAGTHSSQLDGEAAGDLRMSKAAPRADVSLAQAWLEAGRDAQPLTCDAGGVYGAREVA